MLFIVILVLTLLSGTCSARSTYAITFPSTLRTGSTFNVTFWLFRAIASPVNVVVNVNDKDNLRTVFSHKTVVTERMTTFPVKLPANVSTGEHMLRVKATGSDVSVDGVGKVTVTRQSLVMLVQSDKAIYKPGQTVKFRIVVLDVETLLPRTAEVAIDVLDAQSNKVARWVKKTNSHGVVSQELPLSDYPLLGEWRIRATVMDESTEKEFTVDEYVLPKFEVKLKLPSHVIFNATSLEGSVSAKYTHGKAVKGQVEMRLRSSFALHWSSQVHESFEMDGKKEFEFQFPRSFYSFSNNRINGLTGPLVVECNVTESLTGVTLSTSESIDVVSSEVELSMAEANAATFKPGLDYVGYIKVKRRDGSPLPRVRQTVTLKAKTKTNEWSWNDEGIIYEKDHELTVPDDGVVSFRVKTSIMSQLLTLRCQYGSDESISLSVDLRPYYSPSKNYLGVYSLQSDDQVAVGGEAQFVLTSTQPDVLVLYQVLNSRGMIVHSASHPFTGRRATIRVPVVQAMIPRSRLVAFYVGKKEEVVADAVEFKVTGDLLNHKVAIALNKKDAAPGSEVTVTVRSAPQSFVGLLAVDESVLLLKSGNDLTAQQVADQLAGGDRLEFSPWVSTSAKNILDNVGVVLITDGIIPEKRWDHYGYNYGRPAFSASTTMQSMPFAAAPPPAASPAFMVPDMAPVFSSAKMTQDSTEAVMVEPTRTRKLFPETWLFADFVADDKGWSTYKADVPDTLTSWVLSAFAVSKEDGLGIADEKAKLRVLQPFFLSLNLPYSVVRGEEVGVQVTLFNYFDHDLVGVSVTLKQSDEFGVISASRNDLDAMLPMSSDMTVTIDRVPAQDGKSVSFPIKARKLGAVLLRIEARSTKAADAMEKTMLVKPEGVEKVTTQSVVVDLRNVSSMHTSLVANLPDDIVPDSVRTTLTVFGDLLGPSIEGIDRLVETPSGCGEQNMIRLAPNIFVAQYLTAANAFAGPVKEKVLSHMRSGYQRQLSYRHRSSGGYSAFGESDGSASTWLTAFVVRSFRPAAKLVFVDDAVQAKSVEWLLSLQNADGSFREPGKVIMSSLKSSASSNVTLTAYVLISLLEKETNLSLEVSRAVNLASDYLETHLATLNNVDALAMTAYALQLSGRPFAADDAFSKLQRKAVLDGSHLYWNGSRGANSIETTSYALLCYVDRGLLTDAFPIVRWLVSKRSALGGYDSTQSTVVALQALSEYARRVHADSQSVEVLLKSAGEEKRFSVTKDNALVMQSWEIGGAAPVIPISVEATGSGIALVQMSTYYNVYSDVTDSALDLSVSLPLDTINAITVQACTRSRAAATGMALMEVEPPSGFAIDEFELRKLIRQEPVPRLQRTEVVKNKAVLYFDQLDSTEVCAPVKMARVQAVAKPQHGSVVVYDYYSPALRRRASFESTALKNANICSVCRDCVEC